MCVGVNKGPMGQPFKNMFIKNLSFLWNVRPSDYGMNEETAKFMVKMEDTVRRNFRFHPHIQAAADATVADVSRRVKKSESKKHDVTFVGIHNRRTDHLNFTMKTDRAKPIKPKYFREAMEYFRYYLWDHIRTIWKWKMQTLFLPKQSDGSDDEAD